MAWPPVATCSAEAITTCWAGQMTNQTLAHIVLPSMPPKKIFQPYAVAKKPAIPPYFAKATCRT
jgi:hypothetical protein